MTDNRNREERQRAHEDRQEQLKQDMRALPGEIWRDFFSTLGFWTVMVLVWAAFTGVGAAVGYGIGGDDDGLWLGAAIVGGVSPVLMGFAMAFDLPRKVWRKMTGRR
ncbi:hypothetical protein CDO73_14865 [Saccharibacillus sp. O23]|uniref:hypothetical protein n=1 Tax=Saccharibacillus sp. O23 TaxID=2009338 RepID=UPI000B4E5F22|nr:hypothetical protein [Saccharibacillus sp. O23]OWR29473.1 hypothetical protein CDO73_14865 [Saccharibacillus sp. O23]